MPWKRIRRRRSLRMMFRSGDSSASKKSDLVVGQTTVPREWERRFIHVRLLLDTTVCVKKKNK